MFFPLPLGVTGVPIEGCTVEVLGEFWVVVPTVGTGRTGVVDTVPTVGVRRSLCPFAFSVVREG